MTNWFRPLRSWLRSFLTTPVSSNRTSSSKGFRSLRIDGLEERRMLAIVPQLIADIGNRNQANGGVIQVGSTIFYSGVDPSNNFGTELWKTDLNTFTATLVKDIDPFSSGSNPYNFTNVNGTLFFVASRTGEGAELWKSNGTSAGTVLVKDIMPGASGSLARYLTNVNGTLVFAASNGNGANGLELWKSDGTSSGTVIVKDIRPGTTGSYLNNVALVGNTIFFNANNGGGIGPELWKSDGTSSGTVLVKDIRPGGVGSYSTELTNVGGVLFFQSNDGGTGTELWKSDGTSAGTQRVRDIALASSMPSALVNVNGTLFFQANDGTTGSELWKSDGSSAGTVLVKDINAGGAYSNVTSTVNVNGTLYFSATDGAQGNELWKSDGTSAGTVRVLDINVGAGDGNPLALTNVNGLVYFNANNGTNGIELWKSDGTSAGTRQVRDILIGSNSSVPAALLNVNGTLLFQANDGSHGTQLYKSDGTFAGTSNVRDSYAGNPFQLTNVNGVVYFAADDGARGVELWRSDLNGVSLVKDIDPLGGSNPSYFTNVNGTLFFRANDGTNGSELWKSDGTNSGTVLVRDIFTGVNGFVINLVNVNGTLFFSAQDNTNGIELWKSDGTSAGTVRVRDIHPAGSSFPQDLVDVNGTLFFRATDGVSGYELWKSDGTSAGTVLVRDIQSGPADGAAGGIFTPVNVNGTLFFRANDGVNGSELWKSNGTSTGTVMVRDILPGGDGAPTSMTNSGGTLVFSASNGASGSELWKSDGTSAGTVMVKDINPGAGNSYPTSFATVNGTLFFRATNGVNGLELWKSDGTSAGTVLVKDIRPVGVNSNPGPFVNMSGTLFFRANDGVNGYELWKSDGTSAGTTLVADIRAGGGGSPGYLTNINGRLYFTADDGVAGQELWALDFPTVSLSLAPSNLTENGGVATVTATLSVPSLQAVTVSLAFTGTAINNIDYSASAPQIVVPAGSLTGSITLTGLNDTAFEANESVIVDISAVDAGLESGTQQVTATINNNLPPSMNVTGSTLTITGSAAADLLTIQFTSATNFGVNLNGQFQTFSTGTINTINFGALGGNDTLTFIDAGFGVNTATLSQAGATVSGASYTFAASNLEYKYVFGDALDSVTFNDTAGADQLYQLPQYTLMLDSVVSYYNQVISFGAVTSTATVGTDLLLVFGTAGNDTYVANTTNSTLTSPGLSLIGNNYDQVFAFGLGGNDTATFTGSAGNEVFYGLGGYGYSVINNATYLQYLVGFAQTTVNDSAGTDNAIFYDFAGNDTFTVSPTAASMTGPGYSDIANGFDQYFAYASGGGVDTANLDGSVNDDIFSGNAITASLFRTSVYLIQAIGFEQVNVNLSSTSGIDLAELIDGAGNDVLNATGTAAEITYATGNKIRVNAFDSVFAKNQNGGVNFANVVNPLAFQLVFEGTWL